MSAGAGSAATRSIGQWADDAVQAVRVLNHRTPPATGELTDPADPAEVIAGLAALAGMLPQLLDQLASWLLDQQCGGRPRVDNLAPQPDVTQAVHPTVAALTHAGECLRPAGHAIDTAHQHAAHLATTDDGDDEWGAR